MRRQQKEGSVTKFEKRLLRKGDGSLVTCRVLVIIFASCINVDVFLEKQKEGII